MRDVIRVVLVDPNEESRQALQQLLGSMGSVWIVEVLSSYKVAASRIVEIAPELCLVALDSEPDQAVELIASMVQALPNAVVLPTRSSHPTIRGSDSSPRPNRPSSSASHSTRSTSSSSAAGSPPSWDRRGRASPR